MASTTNEAPETDLDLTLEEQWAVHQALTDYVEIATREEVDLPNPAVEIALLEKIEAGKFSFTAFELDRLRFECESHAQSEYAPPEDRDPARAVVNQIDRLGSAFVGH